MGDSLNPIASGGLLDGSCINLPICFGRWTSRPLPEPPPHHALTLLREIARLVASHSVCSHSETSGLTFRVFVRQEKSKRIAAN